MSQDTSGSGVQLQQPDKLRVAPAEEQINGQDRQGAFEAVPQKGNRPCLPAQGPERVGVPAFPLPCSRISIPFILHKYNRSETDQTHNQSHTYQRTSICHPTPFLSFPNHEPQSGSLKSERIPDLILQISGVGEMHQLLVIYENNEGRKKLLTATWVI